MQCRIKSVVGLYSITTVIVDLRGICMQKSIMAAWMMDVALRECTDIDHPMRKFLYPILCVFSKVGGISGYHRPRCRALYSYRQSWQIVWRIRTSEIADRHSQVSGVVRFKFDYRQIHGTLTGPQLECRYKRQRKIASSQITCLEFPQIFPAFNVFS